MVTELSRGGDDRALCDPNRELVETVHTLATSLTRLDYTFTPADVPANGIYFFFERGEAVNLGGEVVDRIVRVGTHRGDGRLPKRLRLHFARTRRVSVFRRHLGGALLTRNHPNDPRLAAWTGQKDIPMPEIEQDVSQILRDQFTFCCVPVENARDRLNLERGLIALLARHPLAPPSAGWLRRHAAHPAIRRSGLWNTHHVDGNSLGLAGFERLAALAPT